MWLNLYGREDVRRKLKNSLKTQKMHFLPVFERMSLPYSKKTPYDIEQKLGHQCNFTRAIFN